MPRRFGAVKEIDYMKYDFGVDVTDFVLFFHDYSDQLVVLSLYDNSIILIKYDQSFYGTYKTNHIMQKVRIGHKILFTQGYP